MRAIHLDFVQTRRPVGAAGWAMLLIGIATIAAVVGVDILVPEVPCDLKHSLETTHGKALEIQFG